MLTVTKNRSSQKATNHAICDETREKQVLDKVAKWVDDSDYTETIVATYQDSMKHSRDYQNKMDKGEFR